MNKCKICGTEFESRFCPNCGTEFDEAQLDRTEQLTVDILKNGINKTWTDNCEAQAKIHKILSGLSLAFSILTICTGILYLLSSKSALNFPISAKYMLLVCLPISFIGDAAFTTAADTYLKFKIALFINKNEIDPDRIAKSYDIMSLDDSENDLWSEMYLFLKEPQTLRKKLRGSASQFFLNIFAFIFFSLASFADFDFKLTLMLWAVALAFYAIGVIIRKSINKSLEKRGKKLLEKAQDKNAADGN